MDIDLIWKGAVITGLITLNFKLVYAGLKNYKNKKNGNYNGTERRKVRYIDECLPLHTEIIKPLTSKLENLTEKTNEIHGDVQYIKGKVCK